MASNDALQPFRQVRSAFTEVELPPSKTGLSFVIYAVEVAEDTRNKIADIIKGKEEKPLGRFATLLLGGGLGPKTQHVLFHILFVQLSFKKDLKDLREEIMAIFENPEITSQIERNPMVYFSLFASDDGRNDPPLATALEKLKQHIQ